MPVPRGHHNAEVPLAPFREAFKASDKSVRQIAREMGKCNSYVGRLLNDRPQTLHKRLKSGERRRYTVRIHATSYETAMLLCEALGLDPVEAGL